MHNDAEASYYILVMVHGISHHAELSAWVWSPPLLNFAYALAFHFGPYIKEEIKTNYKMGPWPAEGCAVSNSLVGYRQQGTGCHGEP